MNARVVEILKRISSEDPEFRYEFDHPVNPRFRVGGVVMLPKVVRSDAEVVQILKERHRRVTGEYPRRIGAVPHCSYCGNNTTHLGMRSSAASTVPGDRWTRSRSTS